MGNSVAKASNVIATPGTIMFPGAEQGTWTPGPVATQPHTKITMGGSEHALKQAQCTFTFSGVGPAPAKPTVNGAETVILTPQPTKLTSGGIGVLVHGDKQVGAYGNELSIISDNQITTA